MRSWDETLANKCDLPWACQKNKKKTIKCELLYTLDDALICFTPSSSEKMWVVCLYCVCVCVCGNLGTPPLPRPPPQPVILTIMDFAVAYWEKKMVDRAPLSCQQRTLATAGQMQIEFTQLLTCPACLPAVGLGGVLCVVGLAKLCFAFFFKVPIRVVCIFVTVTRKARFTHAR